MLRPALIALITFTGPLWAETAQVTGTAAYLERIAVPQEAELVVELLDTSLQDVAAVQLSAQRFALVGVPQDFALSYDPALIGEEMTYTVSARIEQNGEVLFRSTAAHPVLTRGAGDHVEVVMQMMPAPEDISLEGTRWLVVEIAGIPVETEQPPEILFDAGRVSVATGCNRFAGTAKIEGDALRFADNLAGTLMACPPPMDAQEEAVLQALPLVEGYSLVDGQLDLTGPGGAVLMRLTPVS